ncbi:hypothetical protein J8N05_19370 [Streptomyces sp. BH-SS-21]|uniref:Methyltransferase n=1 Tax=Streptomyces liliiviolaceus TaxID=2823109 RepID=A0A940Y104_9ACTN|nr:hypothetical protein [Streptomyces liliiviolaceus]MBQ0850350.1 hypothetical protein [Streptomyces liliiviolaceus]
MTPTSTVADWEPLWAGGRRDRRLDGRENRLMDESLGPSRGRPALDIGCGDGALARRLHHELREEAGLDDVQVLGTLLDRVGDVARLMASVLITRWPGIPQQREGTLGSWRFWSFSALSQPLFVPSAQCLTVWNPVLPLDHPRALFQPYASPGR